MKSPGLKCPSTFLHTFNTYYYDKFYIFQETNGNLFDGPIDLPSLDSPPARPPSCIPPLPGPKHYQSPVFNGNANTTAQNVEDMYAKVSRYFPSLIFLKEKKGFIFKYKKNFKKKILSLRGFL